MASPMQDDKLLRTYLTLSLATATATATVMMARRSEMVVEREGELAGLDPANRFVIGLVDRGIERWRVISAVGALLF